MQLLDLFLALCLLCMVVTSTPIRSNLNARQIVNRIKRQSSRRRNVDTCQSADIIFVVDSSGSIGLANWFKVLSFCEQIVNQFKVGSDNVRIGMVKYGNDPEIQFHLNTYNTSLAINTRINQTTWMDSTTHTAAGIMTMHTEMFIPERGARSGVPRIAIVITDGNANINADKTKPEADAAKAKGIVMFAIGIGDEISNKTLNDISSDPDEKFVFSAATFDALPQIKISVVTTACEIAAKCREDLDLVFILDESGSVRGANYKRTKDFVIDLLDDINVHENKSHVGLLTFGSSVRIQFMLNRYTMRTDVQNAISNVTYERGTTNTAEALRIARDTMFSTQNGGRVAMKDVIVLFTDGGSNDFQKTLDEAKLTRLADITVIVVAITDWININEVNEIASDPDSQNVILVRNFQDLSGVHNDLKRAICNDKDDCANNQCQNGGTCQDGINNYLCKCPTGFAGVDCEIACPNIADVVVSLDSSTSVGDKRYYQSLEFTKGLARVLNIGESRTRMGVATFSSGVKVQFQLARYGNKKQLVNAISFPYSSGGSTNTADAIKVVQEQMFTGGNGDRSGVNNFNIIITDGNSDNPIQTFKEAVGLRAKGSYILPIGINIRNGEGTNELNGIASDPNSGNVFIVADQAELSTLYNNLTRRVCNSVNECNPNPCQNGGVCNNLIGRYRCDCPTGFTGITCERRCDGVADLVIAIDDSGSIRWNRFELIKNYAMSLVEQMEVRPGRVRVGVLTFSDTANVRFNLNTYEWKEDVMQAINILPYSRGKTNIADTLKVIRQQMFTLANGDRDTAPNYLVLITDGQPTVNVEETLSEAIQARVSGIHSVTVSVEIAADSLVLQGITSYPTNLNLFNVPRFNQLPTIRDSAIAAMCDSVNECDARPCQNGECIDGLGQFICRCRDDFTGNRCERRCTTRQDLIMAVDASGSVEIVFRMAMQLSRLLVEGINFNGGRTRVGAVTWSGSAQVQFQLNRYNNRAAVLNALSFDYMRGRTNTASVLEEMRSSMFTFGNGERSGDRNIALVMTDGRSNVGDTAAAARQLQNSNVRVIAVGIGKDVNKQEINDMATNPDNVNTFFIPTFSDLDTVANSILDTLCS